MISFDPWVWIGAILTIMVLTFLYKETRLYRFAEYTYIGVGTGHLVVSGLNALQSSVFNPIIKGNTYIILPFVFGLLILFILTPRYSYIASYPMAIILGIGTALTMRGLVTSQLIGQLQAMITSLNPKQNPFNLYSNIIAFILTIGSLYYFLFTTTMPKKYSNVGNAINKLGRYGLMIAWGTMLGNVVMSRLSLILSRMLFLIITWLGLTS